MKNAIQTRFGHSTTCLIKPWYLFTVFVGPTWWGPCTFVRRPFYSPPGPFTVTILSSSQSRRQCAYKNDIRQRRRSQRIYTSNFIRSRWCRARVPVKWYCVTEFALFLYIYMREKRKKIRERQFHADLFHSIRGTSVYTHFRSDNTTRVFVYSSLTGFNWDLLTRRRRVSWLRVWIVPANPVGNRLYLWQRRVPLPPAGAASPLPFPIQGRTRAGNNFPPGRPTTSWRWIPSRSSGTISSLLSATRYSYSRRKTKPSCKHVVPWRQGDTF